MLRLRDWAWVGRPAMALVILVAAVSTTRPAHADSTSITIQNFAFGPDSVTVPVGTTVIWTNRDGASHTTTSDDSSSTSWNSGSLDGGQSFSFTFSTAGTFTYHCAIHPFMTGTIIVQGSGTGATSVPPTAASSATAASTAASSPTATPTAPVTPTLTPTLPPPPTATPVPSKHSRTVAAVPKGQTFAFSPVSVTVKVGTRVIWVNKSGAPHTVTSKTKGWKLNKGLNTGQVSFTFKKAGTYTYHCTIHPGMNGKIVVKK